MRVSSRKEHKPICAEYAGKGSPTMMLEEVVEQTVLEEYPEADAEKKAYVKHIYTQAFKNQMKFTRKYDEKEFEALNVPADQVFKTTVQGFGEMKLNEALEMLPFLSNPELRAITTREQLMELLSFADFEKCRKGLDDFDILENALAAMKLAKETGGPAARTPKKQEETGTRCQFCHKKGPTKHCSKCKQAFYCNKECQGKDWKKHKKTCKADAK